MRRSAGEPLPLLQQSVATAKPGSVSGRYCDILQAEEASRGGSPAGGEGGAGLVGGGCGARPAVPCGMPAFSDSAVLLSADWRVAEHRKRCCEGEAAQNAGFARTHPDAAASGTK